MKSNYELCLSGKSCIFVPYRPEHLPNYHEWMQDPFLLEATASEPLSMDEEIEMQREWRDDEKKCTFILLARVLCSSQPGEGEEEKNHDIIPPPPTESEMSEENKPYPQLVEQTLDAMIGDINLFLSEEELEDSDDDERQYNEQLASQSTTTTTTPENLTQGELDLMIAAASHRHKNLGAELALMMMHYGAKHLQLRRFFVKIKDTNHSSLKLFKEKLGFVQCAYAECFGEYELECKCENSELMMEWVERRYGKLLCAKKKKSVMVGNDADGEGCDDDYDDDQCSRRPCRMYDVYKCPLDSSA